MINSIFSFLSENSKDIIIGLIIFLIGTFLSWFFGIIKMIKEKIFKHRNLNPIERLNHAKKELKKEINYLYSNKQDIDTSKLNNIFASTIQKLIIKYNLENDAKKELDEYIEGISMNKITTGRKYASSNTLPQRTGSSCLMPILFLLLCIVIVASIF